MILPLAPPARPRCDVLVVGGGTVGHLAPGFAVAERLRERGVGVEFATPGEPDEARWFPAGGPRAHACPAPRLPRRAAEVPAFAPRLGRATVGALGLIRRLRPRVVVGLGGWPCVPAALASRLAAVPLVLLASDRRPGLAVRRLAPLARRIYVVHEDARAALGGEPRVHKTGPVLRRGVRGGAADPLRFGLEPGRPTLLVVGGSLGARAINEAVAAGLTEAVRADASLAGRVQVIHSVGRAGEGVARSYREVGLRHHVTPFLEEMGAAYRTATLALCRAGAITCAELAANGLPAVLVPYPHHADRQQYENARPLVARGGAVLLDESELDPGRVRDVVLPLLDDLPRLRSMARAMAAEDEDGALQITDDLVRLLEEGGA